METVQNIAGTLIHGVDFITHLLHAACIVMGVVLWVMAFGLWKAHRYNPKYVPLDKPIVYVMLGFVLVGIPFVNRLIPTGMSIDLQQQKQATVARALDIDTPIRAADGAGPIYDIDTPLEGISSHFAEE